MKYIFLLLLLFVACSPAARLRRAEKLIAKAEQDGATWHVDTIYLDKPFYIERTQKDTLFVSKPGDTVIIQKDRLKMKYVKLPGDTVFLDGECEADTVIVKQPVTITKTIDAPKPWLRWWHLIVAGLVGAGVVAIFKR